MSKRKTISRASEIRSLRKEIAMLEASNLKLHEEIAELRAMRDEETTRAKQLADEKADMRRQVRKLRSELAYARNDFQHMRGIAEGKSAVSDLLLNMFEPVIDEIVDKIRGESGPIGQSR
jgi:chromosome segregation ATPase